MNDNAVNEMVCYNHPNRETMLRCNRCERPICSECAVKTPTGYRCKECVRSQQKVFDTAKESDYVIAVLIAGVFAFLGSFFTALVGFFTIFIAPIIGGITAAAVRAAVRRRRAKLLFQMTTAAAVLGSLLAIAIGFFSSGYFSLIWQGLYTFLIASTIYYRLSGIQINR